MRLHSSLLPILGLIPSWTRTANRPKWKGPDQGNVVDEPSMVQTFPVDGLKQPRPRRSCMIRLACVILFLVTCAQAQHAAWQPAKTWVFAVGVLKFDDSSLVTWPDEGRADAEMIKVMQQRGVPADHILFLKNEQATKANVTQKFAPFLQRAEADDTLVFYYAGHGARNYSKPDRTCTFVTYDTTSTWTVSSVFDTVQQNFHGAQVIYFADCCHSGSLVAEAARRKERAGVLASAHVSSSSTGNWTFTTCLVEMFRGNPVLDVNGDGDITFTEAASYVEREMSFFEGQHAVHGVSGSFTPDLTLAAARGKHTLRMGDQVEGESHGKWWRAEILAERDGKYFVTWPGWPHSYDEWLPASLIRKFTPPTLPVGTPVMAEWRKQWFPGRVVKTELGLHLIHYDGFPDSDDEWMGMSRLKTK